MSLDLIAYYQHGLRLESRIIDKARQVQHQLFVKYTDLSNN